MRLGRALTFNSISKFRMELNNLRLYLTLDAKIVFYSCIAGAGTQGDQLLRGLSRQLPGRTVIGFIVKGETDAGELLSHLSAQSPGRVREAPHGKGSGRPGKVGLLTPWSGYAKWARDGVIVRQPSFGRGPRKRCANPACPGHSSIARLAPCCAVAPFLSNIRAESERRRILATKTSRAASDSGSTTSPSDSGSRSERPLATLSVRRCRDQGAA